MAIEQTDKQIEMINRYIEEKVKENSGSNGVNQLETKKIDIRKDSTIKKDQQTTNPVGKLIGRHGIRREFQFVETVRQNAVG